MTTQLMASVVFGGDFGDPEFTKDVEEDIVLDVDLAADELRRAGYEVHRLPDKYGGSLAHPLDDFIEAVTVGTDDPKVVNAIWNQIEAIVAKYGGYCESIGPIDENYAPFADLFKEWRP